MAVIFKQEETSGHYSQSGLDTKTDRLTDRQLQCDSDSNLVSFHSRFLQTSLHIFSANQYAADKLLRCKLNGMAFLLMFVSLQEACFEEQ
jgi:hypothetical protein